MARRGERLTEVDRTSGIGRRVQSAIFKAGASGARPAVPASWSGLTAAAKRAMSSDAWAYVAGSSGREDTAAANMAAFEKHRLVPRVLRDVSSRDLVVELLGHRYPAPLLAAPVGVLELVHPDADLAIARACASLGIPAVLSNQASVPMETVAAEGGGGPLWFQLYWSADDDLARSLVTRAERAGAEAIVVTLDTHLLGWRPRDLDRAYLPFVHGMGIAQYTSDPVFARLVEQRAEASAGTKAEKPKITAAAVRTLIDMTRRHPGAFTDNLRSGLPRVAVETFLDTFSRPNLQWPDLARLREWTSLPIVLKGIQHPDDARQALDAGVDAVWVSNHAGRQVDGALASLDALPAVLEVLDGGAPVIFDSGVRSGADIAKALALGATAVAVGRPWVYGMAVAGERGAAAVLANLLGELDLVLGLTGHTSVSALEPGSLA